MWSQLSASSNSGVTEGVVCEVLIFRNKYLKFLTGAYHHTPFVHLPYILILEAPIRADAIYKAARAKFDFLLFFSENR